MYTKYIKKAQQLPVFKNSMIFKNTHKFPENDNSEDAFANIIRFYDE